MMVVFLTAIILFLTLIFFFLLQAWLLMVRYVIWVRTATIGRLRLRGEITAKMHGTWT